MEPELVANLLVEVERSWVEDAVKNGGIDSMRDSCVKVASAIIQGSDGDRDRVGDYMDVVCGEKSIQSWEKQMCLNFSQKITDFMRSDVEYNRDYLNVAKFCTSFYEVVEGTAEVEEKRRIQAKAAAEAAAIESAKKKKEAEQQQQVEEKKAA